MRHPAKWPKFLLLVLAALAGGCAGPVQPGQTTEENSPPVVPGTSRLMTKSEAINPVSDDPARPWEMVWALTEDTYNGKELFLTIHRRLNQLVHQNPELFGEGRDSEYRAAIYVQVGGKYKLLRQLLSYNSYFLKPNYFRALYSGLSGKDTDYFLQITEVYYGTGQLVSEHIFKPRPDLMLEEVEFTPAPDFYKAKLLPDEEVAKGEYNEFSDKGLFFHFAIWKKDDGNCCPTAGQVDGAYKMERIGQDGPFRMTVDTYQRSPIDPNE